MKSGPPAKRMPPAQRPIQKLQFLTAKQLAERYGETEAAEIITATDKFFPPKVGDNRTREYGVSLTPVAPLTKAQRDSIVTIVSPQLAGIDWRVVHDARAAAAIEHERVTHGVPYSEFKRYLDDVERRTGELLRLLEGGRPEMRLSLSRRGAGVAAAVNELREFRARLQTMQTMGADAYRAPPTQGITTLTAKLADVFDAAGLRPTSGRGRSVDSRSPFFLFVTEILRTLPIEYDGSEFALVNLIGDAIRSRKKGVTCTN
jgi:hypothetical protein